MLARKMRQSFALQAHPYGHWIGIVLLAIHDHGAWQFLVYAADQTDRVHCKRMTMQMPLRILASSLSILTLDVGCGGWAHL